ncbi:MAG: molybdenum cofactor biosynthesis protein MoaE [Pseudomonadota bacterium]
MTVSVQEADFNVAEETAHLTHGNTDIGAVVTFTGLVRGGTDTNPAASMTLEHYPGMTESELERIEAEAHTRWPLSGTRIVHRVGALEPGENIVLVIAASRHRQAAFEAAAFLMDYLKTKAPFWKKEADQSGQGNWVDARDSDDAALERWS